VIRIAGDRYEVACRAREQEIALHKVQVHETMRALMHE
jgi:hypothetical protein